MAFHKEKHARFLTNCLNLFPSKLQSEDSNKLALTYFSLNGLDILQKIQYSPEKRQEYIGWLYKHLVSSKEGFRGSLTHELPQDSSYDVANISATYFALCCLLILRDDITKLDREKIMSYISKCQLPNGGFSSINGGDIVDCDIRYCLMASQIRYMLKYDEIKGENDIDVDKLSEHLYTLISYNGGFGGLQFQESHSGLTFCGLSCLKLINRIDGKDWEVTKRWLVQRQIDFNEFNEQELDHDMADIGDIGGFNGRENKFADTCYSWWTIGSLKVLGSEKLIDTQKAIDYLLTQTQHDLIGGFGKTNEDTPDPLHTCLGLGALSLLGYGEGEINEVDELLVLTKSTLEFHESLTWK